MAKTTRIAALCVCWIVLLFSVAPVASSRNITCDLVTHTPSKLWECYIACKHFGQIYGIQCYNNKEAMLKITLSQPTLTIRCTSPFLILWLDDEFLNVYELLHVHANITNIKMDLDSVKIKSCFLNKFPSLSTFNTSLKRLQMSGSWITHINNDTFLPVPNLQRLDLTHNRISNIADGSFQNLSKLTWLGLSNNRIEELHSDTFLGLISLQLLSLNSNNVKYIVNGTFQHLPSLKILDLSDNDITTIAPSGFAGMSIS